MSEELMMLMYRDLKKMNKNLIIDQNNAIEMLKDKFTESQEAYEELATEYKKLGEAYKEETKVENKTVGFMSAVGVKGKKH